MSGRRRTCSPKVQTSLDSVNHTDSVPLRNGNKPVEARIRGASAGATGDSALQAHLLRILEAALQIESIN